MEAFYTSHFMSLIRFHFAFYREMLIGKPGHISPGFHSFHLFRWRIISPIAHYWHLSPFYFSRLFTCFKVSVTAERRTAAVHTAVDDDEIIFACIYRLHLFTSLHRFSTTYIIFHAKMAGGQPAVSHRNFVWRWPSWPCDIFLDVLIASAFIFSR